MSSFDGYLREYPGIIIDRFVVQRNRGVYAAFLSHAHTDHMVGIENYSLDAPIYCTETTATMLQSIRRKGESSLRYSHLGKHLVSLAYDVPHQLRINDRVIYVTLIDSNHCPGSCMFLFEGSSGRVLYTGDMRAEEWFLNYLEKHPSLISDDGVLRMIDTIYLDTTFAHPDFHELPSKQESGEALCKICDYFIAKLGPDIVFYIPFKCFGPEFLWKSISEYFGASVCINESFFSMYDCLKVPTDYFSQAPISSYLTTDPYQTRFHVTWNEVCGRISESGQCIRITPSTMFWKFYLDEGRPCNPGWDCDFALLGDTTARLLYSMHSSLKELQNFVTLFQPRYVFPCVLDGQKSYENIHHLLSANVVNRPLSIREAVDVFPKMDRDRVEMESDNETIMTNPTDQPTSDQDVLAWDSEEEANASHGRHVPRKDILIDDTVNVCKICLISSNEK